MRLKIIINEFEQPLLPQNSQSDIQEWLEEPGKVAALGYQAAGFNWIYWPGLVAFRFDETDQVVAFPEKSLSAAFINDLFQRSTTPLILQSHGIEVLHASAILTSSGVIAFCADAGTGKSTLAYSLGQRGFPIWSDDSVTLQQIDGRFISYRLPFKVRLLPDAKALFQNDNFSEFQASRFIDGDQNLDVKPLAAVCILNRTSTVNWEIIRLAPSDAFMRTMAHAYYYAVPNPAHKQKMLAHYLELVNHVSVFQINFKPGFDLMNEFLNGLDRFFDGFKG